MRLRAAVCLLLGAGLAQAHALTPPRPLAQPPAEWPEGRPSAHDVLVPVVLTVSSDGRVEEVQVEASVDERFDAAALAAARRWRFEPARSDGDPVRAKVRAVVRFVGRAAPPQPQPQPAPVIVLGHGEEEHAGVRVEGARPARSASESERSLRQLAAAPHRTGSDLMQTVPGVFVSQHGGEGKAHQIFFRGFDAAHGQDVEIWVGGAPVNDVSNIHGQGYADLHFVMPEAVRVLRAKGGPYEPSQGDFAVAGSLDYELGLMEPGARLELGAGSFGARRALLTYRPEGEPEQTFAAAELYSSDGFGPGRAARRASTLGQLLLPLGDRTTLRVLAASYAGRFGSAGVLRLDDIERGTRGRFDSYDSNQGGHSTRSQLVTELVSQRPGARLALEPYVVWRSLALRQNYTGYLQDPLNGDRSQQTHAATSVGMRGSLRRSLRLLSARDSVELGVFARSDRAEQTDRRVNDLNGDVVDTRVAAQITALDAGGWAALALHPLRRLVIRPGARFDGLSYTVRNDAETGGASRSAQGAHLGKKLGVDLALWPGLHALASYGEGFRSPQARSLGDGEQTPFATVRSLEAGVRYRDADELALSAAVFHTSLSNDLVFDERTARNEPVPGTQRVGLVLDATATAGELLTSAVGVCATHATFSESDARFAAGSAVPYVPQLVVRTDLGLAGQLARGLAGRAGFGTSTLHRRPLPYGELGKDVFLVDAKAGLRWRELDLELAVTNLFDREWHDGEFVYASSFVQGAAASQLPARHVTVGAPRSLFLSAAAVF